MSDTSQNPRRRTPANFGAPTLAPLPAIQKGEPTPEATPDTVEASAVAPVPTSEKRTATARSAATKSSRNSRGGATGKADQPIQVSLPRSLKKRLDRYKSEQGLSHPTILFDALETTIDQLPNLVKERTVHVGATSERSLFNRPQTVVRREATTEPKETFIIRISQDNKDILEQLAADANAPSRNILLVAAYEAFLPN